jgi:hypothetical protein
MIDGEVILLDGTPFGLMVREIVYKDDGADTWVYVPFIPRLDATLGAITAFLSREIGFAMLRAFWSSLDDEERAVFRVGSREDVARMRKQMEGRLRATVLTRDPQLVSWVTGTVGQS